MRQVTTATDTGEYKIFEAAPGYPGAKRTQWSMADGDVRDAEPADTASLARARVFNAAIVAQSAEHLQPPVNVLTLTGARSGGGAKATANQPCRVRRRWNDMDMKNQAELHYSDIQAEAHGIPQHGKKGEKVARLKAHYGEHAQQSDRAQSCTLAKMFQRSKRKH